MSPTALTYEAAGVSISAGDAFVKRIRAAVHSTHNGSEIGGVGGFAGLYRLCANGRRYRDPVLVGCSDGVGTKVLIAKVLNKLDTVGIDLVAMNVNDLVTCGAAPLFFLDYLAVDRLVPARAAALVRGIARGCREAGCSLLGGETAEMPAVYGRDDFDLAGFSVGVVEGKRIIDGRAVRAGDVIIGLASSGLHSNGFSLARRVFPQSRWKRPIKGLRGTLGAALLKPTRIYVKPILDLLKKKPQIIRAMAHITGGGLPGNLPRVLPKNHRAHIDLGSWRIPPLFRLIQDAGVDEAEMYRVFNMGIGMVLVVRPADARSVLTHFKNRRIAACHIGTIEKGRRGVSFG